MVADVTAVIAVTESSTYLRETIDALVGQTVQPSSILLVSPTPLNLGSQVTVIEADFSTTGQAYEIARERVETQWMWLLHDDSAPLPDTLALLLNATDGKRAVSAAGPKQVGWKDQTDLLEAGIIATRSARRVPELDPGEKDQGQFDHREDVLGVGTAGMLVRSSVLADVGGFDPALGPFGDGFELSRRLRAHGGRVIVVPEAKIRHVRQSFTDSAASFGARRGTQAYNALQGAPTVLFPFLFLLYLVLAPVRALGRLILKDTTRAGGELYGGGFLLRRFGQLLGGRQRLARAKTTDAYRSMYAPLRDVRQGKADIRKALKEADRIATRPTPAQRRDLDALRARVRSAGTLLGLLTLVLGIAGLAPYLSSFAATGGALAPDSYSSRDLLIGAVSSWVPMGDGYPGYLEPLWVLAIPFVWVAEFFGTSLTTVTFIVLLLGPFLAGMAGFRASREIANSAVVRFLAGALWAACPPLLSSISVGSVAAVVFHISLPLMLAALARYNRTGASSSLGASAWWMLISGAAYPPIVLGYLILALILTIIRRAPYVWAPIPALAFVAPALWEAAKNLPDSLALVPGMPHKYSFSSMWEILAGWPEGIPGSTFVWWASIVAAVLVVIAAIWSLARTAPGVVGGWLLAALGLGLITVVSLSDMAWPGPGMSLTWLGLLVAIISASHGLRADLSSAPVSLSHLAVGVLVLALIVTPVLSAVSWIGSEKTIVAESGDKVPAIAQRNSTGPERSRVLVLDPHAGGMDVSVWRGNGSQLTEAVTSVALAGDGDLANDSLAASLGLIGSPDLAPALAEHAISIVLVREDDQMSRDLALALDATDGLDRVTTSELGTFWRIANVSRVSQEGITLESGRISATVEAEEGMLFLAERSDPRWVATMDGEELETVDYDWRQVWAVPQAGTVHISHEGVFAQWWMLAMRVMALLANVVVSLPLRRTR